MTPLTEAKQGGHTPGPWFLDEDDKHGQAVVSSEHTEVATCWHHCVGSIEKQMRANAILIAAAPELLEALEGLMAKVECGSALDCERCDAARAAIAKARGAA